MNGSGTSHLERRRTKRLTLRRLQKGMIWSMFASFGSFLVVTFSFLIPSFQDQYDRWKAHEVIESYEKIGDSLYRKDRFTEAEKVYERAFELSENRRLDLDMKRLKARVFKVFEGEEWKRKEFEELSQGDYLFLIEAAANAAEKATIMAAYGTFLALAGNHRESLDILMAARALDRKNPIVLVNLGNAYADLRRNDAAVKTYEEALALDPKYYEALYNLGALHFNSGNCEAARDPLSKAFALRKEDVRKSLFRKCFEK